MAGLVQLRRLGGWTRLWVVVSVSWVAFAVLIGTTEWPNREAYSISPTDYDALAAEYGGIVSAPGNVLVDLPNGETLSFPAGTPKSVMEKAARDYVRQYPEAAKPRALKPLPPGTPLDGEEPPAAPYDDEAFSDAKSAVLTRYALIAFIPPALLAAAMFGFGWVRRGFAGN